MIGERLEDERSSIAVTLSQDERRSIAKAQRVTSTCTRII